MFFLEALLAAVLKIGVAARAGVFALLGFIADHSLTLLQRVQTEQPASF